MPPLNSARRRASRALLSALAGSGLTAAGLGGPLANAASAASGAPAVGDGSSAASAEAGAGSQQSEGGQSTTTTTTTETSTTPAETTTSPTTTPTETTSAPTTTAPTATAPSATTPAAAPTTTAPQAGASAPAASEAPTVVLKRKQKPTAGAAPASKQTSTAPTLTSGKSTKPSKKASGPSNVALSPQAVALEARALAAILASAETSDQALAFYRIPLFLLPIYKAAAVQYGVPWQILAAINEIETDYGNDLSVSTAGAVGWMQFMPSTWLQYGVDALNAGYADPYNPVDAIFAAARYLRAAGAATDLRAAILAYNHSEEYVESVLLRAKLIASYPKDVIATLTGLVDGRLPVSGRRVAWSPLASASPPASSATAGATAVPGATASAPAPGSAAANGAAASGASASIPGSSAPLSPTAAAAAATSHAASAAAEALQLVELMSAPNASVVAVQDGRIVRIGDSRKLGRYIVLRDVYGDVFTYAGLGSIAPSYVLAKTPKTLKSPVVEAASTRSPTPSQPASAGIQSPVTLRVKTPLKQPAAADSEVSVPTGQQELIPAGMGRARLFAHPGNPDARAAVAASAKRRARRNTAGQRLPLRSGSVVASGTVLGRVSVPPGARDGHMRFAIRPAGDSETINPGPVLSNWAQLQAALHPRGAKATNPLLGATASDVFLLSKAQLERAVLSDPAITLAACARHEIAVGLVDRRLLAVLAFLSRSGLTPTVGAMSCGARQYTPAGAPLPSDDVDITAINGTPIAGHQGQGTITDLTIRTLLSLPREFVPEKIVSLMRYPGSSSTDALPAYWDRLHLEFAKATATTALQASATANAAHSAGPGRTAPAPLVTASALSAAQWNQLMSRVSALPMPTVATKPSSAAIPDPKRR
jgi:soluble lytic murein transglycosylase-like protein